MDLVILHMMCADGQMCKDQIKHTIAYKDRRYQHYVSCFMQEVEDKLLLDFQWLRAYQYQHFQLKTLHAIAEGVTTLLTGHQEMPAPNLGYRSGAYH